MVREVQQVRSLSSISHVEEMKIDSVVHEQNLRMSDVIPLIYIQSKNLDL